MRDDRADQIVQLDLSLFSVLGIKQDFSWTSSGSRGRLRGKELLLRSLPGLRRIPMYLGMRFVPVWKSLPSMAYGSLEDYC